jgi:zeaxanthin glucosyltransferase
MPHFVFVAPPLQGHLRPMRAIALALRARGHRTSFVQIADAAGLLGAGDDRLIIGSASHPPGSLDAMVGRLGALPPLGAIPDLRGLRGTLRDLAALTRTLCTEAPEVLRAENVDAIVADQTEAAGGLIARHLRLPYASIANALPINPDPDLPPPFTGWTFRPTPFGRWRNRGGYRVSDVVSRTLNREISRWSDRWGLPGLASLESCLSPRAQLSQMVAGLDFPRAAMPAGFRYLGPFRDMAPEPAAEDGGPLAFVSFGTLQGGRTGLLRAIAVACAGAGLRPLIAHGGRLDQTAQALFPPGTMLRDFVPQRAILPSAAVAITHGGLNTVLDSLAAGVPLVVVPLAFEQAAIARRVAWAGCGIVVRPRGGAAMAAAMAQALAQLRADPAYARRAAAFSREIAGSPGAPAAASVIEGLLAPPI